ncbi:MAG: class I SAM-dependent methyltransferase [Puniceicoccales bacterium]
MTQSTTDASGPRSAPLYRQAQEWLRPALSAGNDWALDATCGNGHDTLFLCQTLLNDARVMAFDLQQPALANTRERLAANGFRPSLHQVHHADFEEFLTLHSISSVSAAIFNLGYLPGGDHSVLTRPDSTSAAIQAILRRASSHFRLSVVAYRGHPGGPEEAHQIQSLLQREDSQRYWFTHLEGSNRDTGPIFLGLSTLSLPA